MWALIYTVVVIGTVKPEVYNINTYNTYVECFKMQKFHSPKLKRNQSLNCVMIRSKK